MATGRKSNNTFIFVSAKLNLTVIYFILFLFLCSFLFYVWRVEKRFTARRTMVVSDNKKLFNLNLIKIYAAWTNSPKTKVGQLAIRAFKPWWNISWRNIIVSLTNKEKQRREMHQFQNRYYTFKTVTLIKKMMCSTVCQNFKVPLLCYFKDS